MCKYVHTYIYILYCKVGTIKTSYSFLFCVKALFPIGKEHESIILESLKPYYNNNGLDNGDTNDRHITISI